MATKIGSAVATRHENMATAARTISDLFEKYPELEVEFRNEFSKTPSEEAENMFQFDPPQENNNGQKSESVLRQPADRSNIKTIIELFWANGNNYISTPEITKLAGLDTTQVTNVLYSAKAKEIFQKSDQEGSKKNKVWRLTREYFAEIQREREAK